MARFICILYFLLTANSICGQTHLFGDYFAQYTSPETTENQNDRYIWIYKDGRYYMLFPQTADGLANLHDKLLLILTNSGLDLDDPIYADNLMPNEYQDLKDYSKLSDLINRGIIRTHARWELNERQLGVTASKDFYIIFVKNLN